MIVWNRGIYDPWQIVAPLLAGVVLSVTVAESVITVIEAHAGSMSYVTASSGAMSYVQGDAGGSSVITANSGTN